MHYSKACLCLKNGNGGCDDVYVTAFPTLVNKTMNIMDLCDRQKRDVHYSDHLTDEDLQLLKQTLQPSPRFRRELLVTPVSKENATRYCAERISETKIGKLCAKVGANVQALVNTCSADVEVSKLLLLSEPVFTCFTPFSHICFLTLKPARFLFLSLPW